MPPLRTFVAVETPPEIRHRAEALVERLRGAGASVRWSDPASWHWTLNFLGDVPDREVPDVCKAAIAAAATVKPFELEVCGCGAFPAIDRPRTLWLGTGEGRESMISLQGALVSQLAELGFRPEARRYLPHLTLGRLRDGTTGLEELAELLRRYTDFDAGMMWVSEVTLFSSRLERSGAVHTPLGHGPLGG
jgi:2'-5' RNA ligase